MDNEGIIQISKRKPSGNWNPIQGDSLTRFLKSKAFLSENEEGRLVEETLSIMRQCKDPKTPQASNITGLVMGYVQSGKTMSFTSLFALAQDNDYQIVLLLAGTKNNLVEQSFKRLKRDLEVEENRTWKLFSTRDKGFQLEEVTRIQSELSKWRRNSRRARTVLIVCMKQHQHIKHLTALLANTNLEMVPTLIIDDEGDQAGMNTKALKKEVSTTHARINELRKIFPNHSYLLYTATPQAPLLISRIDTLSPDFGVVLTPGDDYVGGKEFFIEGAGKYIECIPESDISSHDHPPETAPDSFLQALVDFFVGVAIGLHENNDRDGKNRSMMIHPAVPTMDHFMFKRWTLLFKDHWTAILREPDHPNYSTLLEDFKKSFKRLTKTYSVNCNFSQVKLLLLDAVSETAVVELNTREKKKIPSIDWSSEYSWILIGGMGLDRGFTVEGLTISYMPRSTGIGNIDSIQQRARFFGYKKHYLGLCRIYLTQENIDAFEGYVSHEESVRGFMLQNIQSNKPLKEWRRRWFLDRRFNPTRDSVIALNMSDSVGRGKWIFPDHPYKPIEFVENNRNVADRILQEFELWEYREDGWNDSQAIPFYSNKILLAEIVPFIGQFRNQSPDDNLKHVSMMMLFDRLTVENPSLECNLYAFSGPGCGVSARRSLGIQKPPKIRNLFQGRSEATNYPGARKIRSQNRVSFQIHRYDLESSDKSRVLVKDLPILATYIPQNLSERVWIERDGDAY